jgi:hypothetical protein
MAFAPATPQHQVVPTPPDDQGAPAHARRRSAPARVWSAADDAVLAAHDDPTAARLLGCRAAQARHRRAVLGLPRIPARPAPPTWTPAMDARLGHAPDAVIAAELGVRPIHVFHRRHALQIPAFLVAQVQQRDPLLRDPAVRKLLRRANNTVVMQRLGLTPFQAQELRKRTRIPNPAARPVLTLTDDQQRLLGTAADATLARRWGLPRATVCRHRELAQIPAHRRCRDIVWTAAMVDRLGQAPDAEVAVELGMSIATVNRERRGRQIPSYGANHDQRTEQRIQSLQANPQALAALAETSDVQFVRDWGITKSQLAVLRKRTGIRNPAPSVHVAIPPALVPQLAALTDAAVAQILGCSPATIATARRRLGIAKQRRARTASTA